MTRLLSKIDGWLAAAVVLLLVLSGTMIRSVSPELFPKHLFIIAFSLLVFLVVMRIDYRIYFSLRRYFYFLAIALLVANFLLGTLARGSVRWIQIGPLNLQASELVKPLLIIAFAGFLAERPAKDWRSTLASLIWLVVPLILVFIQPDLGSSLVLGFIWLGMVVASGLPWKLLVGVGSFLGLLLPLGWRRLADYQQLRVTSFFDPFADPLGSGYNLIQSMIAVGSGRWWGRGLGRGPQSQLDFLPERHTDFIFASLSEELGFLGGVIIISLLGILLWRILQAARKTDDQFGRLICIGVFAMIWFQSVVNIGMNLGLLPVAGVTLPLVSYGGSSLLATMIGLGVVASVRQN